MAGVTAVALTYPLDLVRASMATPSSTHTSMAGAMRSIVEQRGVGALYNGIGATVVGVAPYAGLKFGVYEALKGALSNVAGVDESQLKPWQRVSAGAVAGLIAQTAVYPLDVVRRRMQTHARAGGTSGPRPCLEAAGHHVAPAPSPRRHGRRSTGRVPVPRSG
jgi:solute carrier family 25 protein 42